MERPPNARNKFAVTDEVRCRIRLCRPGGRVLSQPVLTTHTIHTARKPIAAELADEQQSLYWVRLLEKSYDAGCVLPRRRIVPRMEPSLSTVPLTV